MDISLTLFKRLNNAYLQALKNAPATVEQEMALLGELIAELTPFVTQKGGYDEGDLAEITGAQQNGIAVSKLRDAARVNIPALFVINGIDMVYRMALSMFNKLNDEGDLVLGKIADQCGIIATKAIK